MKFSTVINIHENLILVSDEIKRVSQRERQIVSEYNMHVEEEFGHIKK